MIEVDNVVIKEGVGVNFLEVKEDYYKEVLELFNEVIFVIFENIYF